MNAVNTVGLTLKSLNDLIRDYRRRSGWTQQEVADRARMSVGGLRDLEQRRVLRPRGSTLRRLAAALELSPSETAELVRLGRHGPILSADFCVRVLGPISVHAAGGTPSLGSDRQRTTLALLALSPGVPVGREALIDAVWGTRPPATAEDLIQAYVSRMRRRFRQVQAPVRPQLLITASGGYRLSIAVDQLDLLAFRGQAEAARRRVRDGDIDAAFTAYRNAVALWRGEPLADLPALQIHPAVVALSRERLAVLQEYADVAARCGRLEEPLPLLHGLVEADPLNEAAHARLMGALAGTGRQAAALELYDTLRRRLADELGIDPGPQLQDVYQSILRGDTVPAVPGLPAPPVTLRPSRRPAVLPTKVRGFAGRTAELAFLDQVADEAAQDTEVPTIVALVGTLGAGKTSLAVHWARRTVDRFPGGQVSVNLLGSTPDVAAMPTSDALEALLRALGVPPPAVPVGIDERARLYQETLAGRRVLVLLDNAHSLEQIELLLPTEPGCLTLVTSTDHLTGLVTEHGAHMLPVGLLRPEEARALLANRLGQARVAAEPDAAAAIADRCARLPAALAAVAAQAAARPTFPLAAFADRLSRPDECLETLDGGADTAGLRRMFLACYRELGAGSARLFRLLGSRNSGAITAAEAAGLANVPLGRARALLAELARMHLVTEHAPGQYSCHRLLRAFAAGLTAEVSGDAA